MRLDQYFRQPYFRQALDSFVIAKPHWPLKARHELYRLGVTAFGSEESESSGSPFPGGERDWGRGVDAKRQAVAEIYRRLIRYWHIFGREPCVDCWDGDRVFDTLTVGCNAVSRTSGTNLISFDGRKSYDVMLRCVSLFADIRPMTGDFPHMPTAKLLHFFNPRLFPIYDQEVVWNKVCNGAFKDDYDLFCRQHGFVVNEQSSKFNVYYTWWASDVMRAAESGIGDVFAEWFASHVGADPDARVITECSGYWGAMFEIAAIGAAYL